MGAAAPQTRTHMMQDREKRVSTLPTQLRVHNVGPEHDFHMKKAFPTYSHILVSLADRSRH